MTKYATVWAFRANPEQSKGRVGRVRKDYCYNLNSKVRFALLGRHLTPEMFRTPLHEIALSIKL